MQRHLREGDLPAILTTGIDTPALDGPSQSVVEIAEFALEVGDHRQVQRRVAGLCKLHPQVEQLFDIALLLGTLLNVAMQDFGNACSALLLNGTRSLPIDTLPSVNLTPLE